MWGEYTCIYIYSFIHSFSILSDDRSKISSKTMPPHSESRASYFKWEYPLLSLRSFNSFLRLLPRLLATSISPYIFPSITYFRRQFLRKMCQIQLAFPYIPIILKLLFYNIVTEIYCIQTSCYCKISSNEIEWWILHIATGLHSKRFYYTKTCGCRRYQYLRCNVKILIYFVYNTVHKSFNGLLLLYILPPTHDKSV